MSADVPRIYVAHPMTSYGSPHEQHCLGELAQLLPDVKLVNPAGRYESDAEWLRDWPRLVPTLAGLVCFADATGTIGTGCLREITDTVAAGIALAAFEPGTGLVELVGIELVEPAVRNRARAAFLDYGHRIDQARWPAQEATL